MRHQLLLTKELSQQEQALQHRLEELRPQPEPAPVPIPPRPRNPQELREMLGLPVE